MFSEKTELAGHFSAYVLGILTFLGCWAYCAFHYGFLFGFGLGWLPSAIAAVMVGGVFRFAWVIFTGD
jgi:hypothetical protein